MPYTFWHQGTLIGETDFEREDGESAPPIRTRRHLAGAFRPTAYGRRLLPRLCGMLTACSGLKDELVRRGLNADDVPPEIVEEMLRTTPAGAHFIDIGRVLSDVELREPSGATMQVESMGFMELAELAALSGRLGGEQMVDPDALTSDVPEFLVSVTLSVPVTYFAQTRLFQ